MNLYTITDMSKKKMLARVLLYLWKPLYKYFWSSDNSHNFFFHIDLLFFSTFFSIVFLFQLFPFVYYAIKITLYLCDILFQPKINDTVWWMPSAQLADHKKLVPTWSFCKSAGADTCLLSPLPSDEKKECTWLESSASCVGSAALSAPLRAKSSWQVIGIGADIVLWRWRSNW